MKSSHVSRNLSVLGLAGLIWIVNGVWLMLDTRPPVWDMAMHQNYALNYSQGFEPRAEIAWYHLSGNYPPFVHVVIAVCYLLFLPSPDVAALANIPATILLLWAVYELALEMAGGSAARWACVITAMTPFLMLMSRETIPDYWLSAWVAASLVLLKRTNGFHVRRPSLMFGLTTGLGLLTKWLFAAWLLFPLLYVVVRHRVWERRDRLTNLAVSLLIAGVFAGSWYLPNLSGLIRYFSENMRFGEREGDPPVFSLQSLIYYLRLLEGYQLFAVLFAILLTSLVIVWSKRGISSVAYLALAVGGGWLVMTMLRTKDPRFTMPMLGLLAIIPGAWIQGWKSIWVSQACKVVLVAFLCVQAYMSNFGISSLPERIILMEGYQGSLRWDWNLYTQDFFGILGPPRRENWKQQEVVLSMTRNAREKGREPALAVIPDLPRFSAANLLLYSRLAGVSGHVDHLQVVPMSIQSFEGYNYVLMKDGDQGEPWTTRNSEGLNRIVLDNPAVFRLVDRYPLPDASVAMLFAIHP